MFESRNVSVSFGFAASEQRRFQMLKKAALALFGLALAGTFMAPPKAVAQVQVGVEGGAPEVVVAPAPVVVYDEPYFVAHNWDSGLHEVYYNGGGTLYQRDAHGNEKYDNKFRNGRHGGDCGRGFKGFNAEYLMRLQPPEQPPQVPVRSH
jgi:hypothetical protein